MSNDNTDAEGGATAHRIILVAPNPTNIPPGTDALIPKPLVDGGVAVAVIMGMTFFTTKLLKSVVEVMKVIKKGK